MKKTFFLAALGCLLCASVSAQVNTYSSNDCNLDGQVNISDVNSVISEMCGESNSVRMIPVDSVCALARSIDSDFGIQLEKSLGIEKTVKVSSISLSPTTATIYAGGTKNIVATISPDEATDKTITWISSNNSVATVADGVVTAVSTGTAIITAIANDGSGVCATCAVTVSDDPSDQYEYVDLGLSVMWAKCNIGATNIYDYGDYFAWGETSGYKSGKKTFSSSTYKYYADNSVTTKDDDGFDVTVYHKGYTKYVRSSDASSDGYDGTFYDNKTTLEYTDDAATVNMGSKWRMPTKSEWVELKSECTWEWKTLNGVKGYKVTATNGNYIFLPAAGYRYDSYLSDAGSRGYYWSSELYSINSVSAWELSFYSSNVSAYGYQPRCNGRSVRAVRSASQN